jgi:ribonuclease D
MGDPGQRPPMSADPSSNLPAPARFAVFDGDLDAVWAELYGSARALAVDTEAMGLIHGRDRLCLVQICDDSDNVCCIRLARGSARPPAAGPDGEPRDREGVPLRPLRCGRPGREPRHHGAPIFCTKVASRLARTYSPRHGLKEVVQELVGIELDKQAQSSDWGRVEDLSEAQLAYAAGDVRYLLPARDRLETMLRREEPLGAGPALFWLSAGDGRA